MGDALVTIPMSEYRKLRDTSTRVKVLLEHMAHYGEMDMERAYLILDMPEDAQMVKEERDELLKRYQEESKKGIEVIGA